MASVVAPRVAAGRSGRALVSISDGWLPCTAGLPSPGLPVGAGSSLFQMFRSVLLFHDSLPLLLLAPVFRRLYGFFDLPAGACRMAD